LGIYTFNPEFGCVILTVIIVSLQTFLGAIRCLKCPVGHYLPVNPIEDESEWICDACSNKVPAAYARHVNAEIGKSL
jgi:hypothetical protein